MEPIVGSGKYTYRVNEEWQQPPEWLDVKACAVSVDSQDRVYCFNRNDAHPIVIFDRDGKFLASWGAGSVQVSARDPHRAREWPRRRLAVRRASQSVLQIHHRRQAVADHRREGQALRHRRAGRGMELAGVSQGDAWRRPVQPADRHRLRARRLDVYHRRLRQCPGPQILGRREIPVLVGRAGYRARASSTCRTASGSTGAAACWSPIGRTTGSRCSTRTANS